MLIGSHDSAIADSVRVAAAIACSEARRGIEQIRSCARRTPVYGSIVLAAAW